MLNKVEITLFEVTKFNIHLNETVALNGARKYRKNYTVKRLQEYPQNSNGPAKY